MEFKEGFGGHVRYALPTIAFFDLRSPGIRGEGAGEGGSHAYLFLESQRPGIIRRGNIPEKKSYPGGVA
jgi:hypothetical protein